MQKKTFLLLTGLLGTSLNLIADVGFAKSNTDLLLNGEKVGVLRVLSPVEVISEEGEFLKIKISGYQLTNYPIAIVRDMQRNEEYALLNKDKISSLKSLKKEDDEYGETWDKVEGIYTVTSHAISKENKSLYAQAKDTYEATCGGCHGVPHAKDYTVNQWPNQIKAMNAKVALDSDTKWLITKYLQQNAKNTK